MSPVPGTNLDTGYRNDKMEQNPCTHEQGQHVQRPLGGGVPGVSKKQQEARGATRIPWREGEESWEMGQRINRGQVTKNIRLYCLLLAR